MEYYVLAPDHAQTVEGVHLDLNLRWTFRTNPEQSNPILFPDRIWQPQLQHTCDGSIARNVRPIPMWRYHERYNLIWPEFLLCWTKDIQSIPTELYSRVLWLCPAAVTLCPSLVVNWTQSRNSRRQSTPQGCEPPIFDLHGSINVLDPPVITPTQSRVQRRTIFVNVIDCVVAAVVEQVYSGAVTCSRDNTRHQ